MTRVLRLYFTYEDRKRRRATCQFARRDGFVMGPCCCRPCRTFEPIPRDIVNEYTAVLWGAHMASALFSAGCIKLGWRFLDFALSAYDPSNVANTDLGQRRRAFKVDRSVRDAMAKIHAEVFGDPHRTDKFFEVHIYHAYLWFLGALIQQHGDWRGPWLKDFPPPGLFECMNFLYLGDDDFRNIVDDWNANVDPWKRFLPPKRRRKQPTAINLMAAIGTIKYEPTR